MDKSDEEYDSHERRLGVNADLRARLDEVAGKVSKHPELTEDDMNQLYELTRDYYRRSYVSVSFDILHVIREVHADDFSPALLALLESVMGRRD